MGKKIAIKIENKTFNSLSEACKYLKINNVAGLSYAVNNGNKKYKDLNIEYIKNTKSTTKKNKNSCPVICENLNVRFKTITDAAKYAQADNWTMSKKMATSGQFIDSKGNIYKRLKLMKTKNIYENTGSTLKKLVPQGISRSKKSTSTLPQPISTPTPQPTKDANLEVQTFLKEKLLSSIKSENYTEAKAYINIIEKLNK